MAHDVGPAELRRQRGDIELLGAVHIEADAVDPVQETQWLATLDDDDQPPLPSALVVGADLSSPEATRTLEAQLEHSEKVRGVRQILNVHEDPLFDYVGRHYMSEPAWRDNFRLLARHDLSFDLQIYPSQMTQAAALAAEHPDTQFLLNHAGMYVDRQGVEGWRVWRDGLRKLAARDNVAIKLSGFGMLDHHWTVGSIRPLILEAIDAFGVERSLFASNFPVDGSTPATPTPGMPMPRSSPMPRPTNDGRSSSTTPDACIASRPTHDIDESPTLESLMLLNDKTVIITGASRGIGRAAALECARQGANLVIGYSGSDSSRPLVDELIGEIRSLGRAATSVGAPPAIRIPATSWSTPPSSTSAVSTFSSTTPASARSTAFWTCLGKPTWKPSTPTSTAPTSPCRPPPTA